MLEYCNTYKMMKEALYEPDSSQNSPQSERRAKTGNFAKCPSDEVVSAAVTSGDDEDVQIERECLPLEELTPKPGDFTLYRTTHKSNGVQLAPLKKMIKSNTFVEKTDHSQNGHRRRNSYEEQFTFQPKLNATSRRLAKERFTKLKNAEIKPKNAYVKQLEKDFTFKPIVCENSAKIVQNLKTSFMDRQQQHMERQKKNFEIALNQQPGPISPIPVSIPSYLKHRKNQESSKEVSLTDSFVDTSDVDVSVESVNVDDADSSECTSPLSDKENKMEITQSQIDSSTINKNNNSRTTNNNNLHNVSKSDEDFSPYSRSNDMSLRRKEQVARLHARRATHPFPRKTQSDIERSDETKTHKRTLSHAHRTKALDVQYERLRQTRLFAENAAKNKKVFVCIGPYPIVRASLRRRNWVEKHYRVHQRKEKCDSEDGDSGDDSDSDSEEKSSNSSKQNSPRGKQITPRGNATKRKSEVKETSVCKKVKEKSKEDDGSDNDSQDSDEEWNAGYEGENEDEYGTMSRMVRNSSAFFIWTCKRDDIDFKFLRKDQIVNHYCRAYSFTTKVGLCTNLKKLPWFENVHPDTFFPRCHKLNSDEEKEDFIDDYRLNATIGLLNWVIEHHGPKTEKQTTSEANNTTDSSPDDKDSSGAKANKKGKTEEGGVVPGDAVALALRACEVHLKCTQHEDIDTDMNFLTEQEWDILITYYYKVILQNGSIESSYKYLSQCQEMHQMMTELLPQLDMGGSKNVWILKPGAKSRGRGITCLNKLEDILKVVGSSNVGKREGKWVIQKYIEHPLLVYNTKFDIRQWFLVTDWNPLTLWFYQDCYIRFCGQQYTLDDFNVSIHLSNNSVQKYYQNGKRDERLPDDNMWSSEDFRTYLKKQGLVHKWDDIVYPGMKQAVMHVLECCQDTLEYRKNSFELYGADFMICDNFKPWLIEINCSPAMGPSTPITKRLCAQVIEDTMKVVLDRKDDKSCDTGRFELAYKQEKVNVPPYIGVNLQVDGLSIQRPPTIIKRPVTSPRTTRPLRNKELTMLPNSNINVLPNIEEKAATTFVEPALFKQPRNVPEGAWAALTSDSRSVSAVSFYNIQKEKRKVHQKPQNPYQLSRTVSTDNMRQPKKVPIAYPSRAVMTLHKSILKYRDSTRRLPAQHRLPIALAPGNGIIKAP